MNLLKTNMRRVGFGVAAALAVTGCSDNLGPDALDEALLLDMAVVAADATLEDVAMWMQPFGFGLQGVLGFGDRAVPGRPGGERGVGHSLSGTRSATFFDADGVEQAAYDPLTTDRIDFVMDVQGDVSRDAWSATISRTREMTITGLAGEETHRTWNGEGTETVSRSRHSDDGEQRSYEMSGSFTYSDVVVPIPGSDSRYPVSGTITREMTGTRSGPEGESTRAVEMTITFDGDETATIVANGETFEVDLTARRGRHPLRPRG